ncbi:uncharacterized protein LOC144438310 [Glandiceps talaboti]
MLTRKRGSKCYITKVYVLNMLEKRSNRAVREERGLNDGLPLYLEKETTEYRIRHACLVCGDYMYFVTGQPSKLYYSTNPVPSLHMRHTVSQSPSTGRMERYEQTMQRSEKKLSGHQRGSLLHIFQQ